MESVGKLREAEEKFRKLI